MKPTRVSLFSWGIFSVVSSFTFRRGNVPANIHMLNRIMFKSTELIRNKPDQKPKLKLSYTDTRTQHISNILQSRDGDTLRIGVLNSGIENNAKVCWLWPSGYDKGWEEEEKHNLRTEILNTTININKVQKERKNLGQIFKQKIFPVGLELQLPKPQLEHLPFKLPRVDLLLAIPRPNRLKKMIPIISQMGVGQIFLVNATKVEKHYFRSHLFQNLHQSNDNNILEKLLIDGLSQSGDIHVPKIKVISNFYKFIEKDLSLFSPYSTSCRILAHPSADDDEVILKTRNLCDIFPPNDVVMDDKSIQMKSLLNYSSNHRILVAIGPEGGWINAEVEKMLQFNFTPVDIGPRILRSDVAVTALLALAHQQIRRWDENRNIPVVS